VINTDLLDSASLPSFIIFFKLKASTLVENTMFETIYSK